MRIRPSSIPLVTVDPFFSLWLGADRLTDEDTCHWTGKPMKLDGQVWIDGEPYRFLGKTEPEKFPAMAQISLDVEAFTTTAVFAAAGVELTVLFTTPILPDDLYLLSRPVSYVEVLARPTDGEEHSVRVRLAASEQFCLNEAGQSDVLTEPVKMKNKALSAARMGNREQRPLNRAADDQRIDWGYLYLAVEGGTVACLNRPDSPDGMAYLVAEADMDDDARLLFTLSYDDVESIQYFGKNLPAYWKTVCPSLPDAISGAYDDYYDVMERCKTFSDRLFCDAVRAGGEKYAELLLLATRQSIGSHKLVLDREGQVLFISKENYSGGFAATADVSYPSIPLYLLYNPELVRGMMRPIYRMAAGDAWKFDFAPHDVGQYPLVNGQLYGCDPTTGEPKLAGQMPVEECGNMLLMEATTAVATGDASFAAGHMDVLRGWVRYLTDNGDDPENQLCTDDFAGHMAHNCNLTVKAILGIAAFGILCGMLGCEAERDTYLALAREKADGFCRRAQNADGSYRLAFDREGTFSQKYNLVWDRILGLNLFPRSLSEAEVRRYRRECHAYGTPLDSRKSYTKADWIVWAATLASDREDFEALVDPLWRFYHETPRRVPMTDWYDTVTAAQCGFQCRTVIGGLFIKLLDDKGFMKIG